MNMLRDEENAKYRSYLKKTVEFDPDILKRYVNFMSNPDERTAIDQFGSGDKYFGISVLLATLPGLPMFGHGQIEGFTERYGMDFKQARLDEYPNDDLIARHQHLIAPLLKSRHLFAGSEHFLLYDFWNDKGFVDENVFAFSNRHDGERALIIYNNSYQSTHGTIHFSVGFLDKITGSIQQRSLSNGLDLSDNDSILVAYRDNVVGLEYLRYVRDLRQNGLSISLRGYQHAAFLKWRELHPTAAQPWDLLCNALHGSGVYSLDEALSKLKIRPLLETLQQAISTDTIESFAALSDRSSQVSTELINRLQGYEIATDKNPKPLSDRAQAVSRLTDFVDYAVQFSRQIQELLAVDHYTGSQTPEGIASDQHRNQLTKCVDASLKLPVILSELPGRLLKSASVVLPCRESKIPPHLTWGPVLAWLILQNLESEIHPLEVFEKFNFRWALAETFAAIGLEGEAAWKAAAQIRILAKFSGKTADEIFRLEAFWTDPDVRWLIGVNNASGIEYVNQERLEETLLWTYLPELLHQASLSTPRLSLDLVTRFVNRVQLANFEYLQVLQFIRANDYGSNDPVEQSPDGSSGEGDGVS